MYNKKRAIQLVESFIKGIEKKYNLLKEGEERGVYPINKNAQYLRNVAINNLKDAEDSDVPVANELKAREIVNNILTRGGNARLNGKPINYDTIVGRKPEDLDTHIQATEKTQTLEMAVEMLAHIFNTPSGQPDEFGFLQEVTEQAKDNIVQGLMSIFNPINEKGELGVLFSMIAAGGNLHFPTYIDGSGKELIDYNKLLEAVSIVRLNLGKKMVDKILTNEKVHSISAYINGAYKKGINSEIYRMNKEESRRDISLSDYDNANEKGSGDNKMVARAMMDFQRNTFIDPKLGGIGQKFWQDVANELKNPTSPNVYKKLGIAGANERIRTLPEKSVQLFQIFVDNLKNEVTIEKEVGRTKEDGTKDVEYVTQLKYPTIISLSRALFENPPHEQYPEAAGYIESMNKPEDLHSQFTKTVKSETVMRAMMLLYITKYKELLGVERAFDKESLKTKDLTRIHQTDYVDDEDKLGYYNPSDESPDMSVKGKKYIPDYDPDDYWATMVGSSRSLNEQELFLMQLQENVSYRLFEKAMLQYIEPVLKG